MRAVRIIAGVILSLAAAQAAEWIRLSTPHFELLTTNGENRAREAILYFEQVRSFFLQASPSKRLPDFPVRIIAFRGEKEFKPYRLNEYAIAYYAGGHERDYIVMQDLDPERFPVAIHEYTHLIIRHTGMKIPVWMNEGWAELYSSLKPLGDKVLVGSIMPGRVLTFQQGKLIPLETLAAVDHASPLYNERNKAGMFYAESWALMHMLYLGRRYGPHFPDFVQATNAGATLAEALNKAFGMGIEEVEKDLRTYLNGQLFGAVFDAKLEKSAEQATMTVPGSLVCELALADLLAVTNRRAEAQAALDAMSKQHPNNPEVEGALGYLAWQGRDEKSARAHFAKAVAAGTRNAQLCYHYAHFAADDEAIPALKRALDLKPDYLDARLQLGSRLMNKRDYAGAIEALRPIQTVTPDQAEFFFETRAYAYWQTGDKERAKTNAELAKKWSKDATMADAILRELAAVQRQATAPLSPEPRSGSERPGLARRSGDSEDKTPQDPLQYATGKARRLDCRGKSAVLTIATEQGPMAFQIHDPAKVVINQGREAPREFGCGDQKGYDIKVGYRKTAEPGATAGAVVTLDF